MTVSKSLHCKKHLHVFLLIFLFWKFGLNSDYRW
jgi:hypothetical protein